MHDDWHLQDWLLIVEALTVYACDEETEPWRRDRADELAAAIAHEHGLDPEHCVEQVDVEWPRWE